MVSLQASSLYPENHARHCIHAASHFTYEENSTLIRIPDKPPLSQSQTSTPLSQPIPTHRLPLLCPFPPPPFSFSNLIIIIKKTNIPRPLTIRPHKLLVPRRPLVPRIPGQHTLQRHAHGFNILGGCPSLAAEKV